MRLSGPISWIAALHVVASLAIAPAAAAATGGLPDAGCADDAGHVIVVGEHGFFATSDDGGQHWTRDDAPTGESLRAVSQGTFGTIAVGDRGTIVRRAQGAWHPATSGTTHTLRAVWSSASWIVVAGGDDGRSPEGVILWSGDAGAHWSHTVVHDASMQAVAGVDPDRVVAVGSRGAIWSTSSRFAWKPRAMPFVAIDADDSTSVTNDLLLEDLVAVRALGVYGFVATGAQGDTVQSNDGLRWTHRDQTVERPSYPPLVPAWAPAPHEATFSTSGGRIYRVAWQGGPMPNPRYYSDLGCAHGTPCPESVVVPYAAWIQRSDDGGRTWIALPLPPALPLRR